MTKRYSGSCVVNLRLARDDEHQIPDQPATYVCSVYDRKSRARTRVLVGHPKHLTRAIDSPEAFDDAARAAISFASEDQGIFENGNYEPAYDPDLTGIHVGRTSDLAHPSRPCDCIDCSVAGEPAH